MGGIFLRDCCLIKDLAECRFAFLLDRRRDVVKRVECLQRIASFVEFYRNMF